jgi:hypothetical protein
VVKEFKLVKLDPASKKWAVVVTKDGLSELLTEKRDGVEEVALFDSHDAAVVKARAL